MSPLGECDVDVELGVPRASGDEPTGGVIKIQTALCSPRERG